MTLAPQIELARDISALATIRWGGASSTDLIGRHESFTRLVERLPRLAESDSPVLLTGETGTGKEVFARALYLLSNRANLPFLRVNCAQYADSQVAAAELFGHRKGAFTNALNDHVGLFEAAHTGILFLDEVGELSPHVQAMLLRVLSEGELVPIGETRARRVDVRVVVATSRDLRAMVAAGQFRADLYYRLRYLHLHLPPLRERGNDWQLLCEHALARLVAVRARRKRFSPAAMDVLGAYAWPGNVREVRALVDTGFHLSEGEWIEPRHFLEALEQVTRRHELRQVPLLDAATACFERLRAGEADFWTLVHVPYLDREFSRADVRRVVECGLAETQGSYKRLLPLFGLPASDYARLMDFLRHHKLKPRD